MGRLVNPIPQEEFEKLPKWQQWIGNHPLISVSLILSIFVGFALVMNIIGAK
jgi:hypothetical protein